MHIYIFIYLFSILLNTTNLGLGNLPHIRLFSDGQCCSWFLKRLVGDGSSRDPSGLIKERGAPQSRGLREERAPQQVRLGWSCCWEAQEGARGRDDNQTSRTVGLAGEDIKVCSSEMPRSTLWCY